jgi:hypothetical protein
MTNVNAFAELIHNIIEGFPGLEHRAFGLPTLDWPEKSSQIPLNLLLLFMFYVLLNFGERFAMIVSARIHSIYSVGEEKFVLL